MEIFSVLIGNYTNSHCNRKKSIKLMLFDLLVDQLFQTHALVLLTCSFSNIERQQETKSD